MNPKSRHLKNYGTELISKYTEAYASIPSRDSCRNSCSAYVQKDQVKLSYISETESHRNSP